MESYISNTPQLVALTARCLAGQRKWRRGYRRQDTMTNSLRFASRVMALLLVIVPLSTQARTYPTTVRSLADLPPGSVPAWFFFHYGGGGAGGPWPPAGDVLSLYPGYYSIWSKHGRTVDHDTSRSFMSHDYHSGVDAFLSLHEDYAIANYRNYFPESRFVLIDLERTPEPADFSVTGSFLARWRGLRLDLENGTSGWTGDGAWRFGTSYGRSCPDLYEGIDFKNEQNILVEKYCAPISSPVNEGAPHCNIKGATNPIHLATGNKFQRENDVPQVGTSPLAFTRYYNSQDQRHADWGSINLGPKWRTTFHRRIEAYNKHPAAERTLGEYHAHRPDGRLLIFDGSGQSKTPNVQERFEVMFGGDNEVIGYQLHSGTDMVEEYDIEGRLSRISTLSDEVVLSYLPEGGLESVTDRSGRQLRFSYADGRLDHITDPNGARTFYAYDVNGNLTTVTHPDSTPGDLADNPRRNYRYEDPSFPTHLTSIVGERDNVVAVWTYDSQGRADSSAHAGGVDSHQLVYNSNGTTSVTDSRGHTRTYSFTNQKGVIKLVAVVGGDCNQCSADAASYTYDGNGYVETTTDFNGNLTRYVRDGAGRELSRTEAEGTPEERVITTTWDTTINKPLEIVEPGRTTSFAYDTQGRMESRVVNSRP